MRTVVALSLLASLCTIEAVPAASPDLEILRLRVRDLKWNIDTDRRQLQLLRIETEDDTLREVSLKWNEDQDSHREYKALLLSGIRTEIDSAKAAGKDVTSCYNEATDGIEKNEQVAYDGAVKCQDVAQSSIRSNLGFIDNLISTGDALSTESDSIFLNCHNSDEYKMQSCIIGELAEAEGALKNLESDILTAKLTIGSISKNVVMQASNCIKQAYSIAYTAGAAIRMRVSQCIATAKKHTTSRQL